MKKKVLLFSSSDKNSAWALDVLSQQNKFDTVFSLWGSSTVEWSQTMIDGDSNVSLNEVVERDVFVLADLLLSTVEGKTDVA